MYCSSCGVAVAQGLSYCNYCGAKVGGAKGETRIKSSEVKPELLVSAMVAVFVLGLVAISADAVRTLCWQVRDDSYGCGIADNVLAFDLGCKDETIRRRIRFSPFSLWEKGRG